MWPIWLKHPPLNSPPINSPGTTPVQFQSCPCVSTYCLFLHCFHHFKFVSCRWWLHESYDHFCLLSLVRIANSEDTLCKLSCMDALYCVHRMKHIMTNICNILCKVKVFGLRWRVSNTWNALCRTYETHYVNWDCLECIVPCPSHESTMSNIWNPSCKLLDCAVPRPTYKAY